MNKSSFCKKNFITMDSTLNYETATVDDFVAYQISFNELPEHIRVQLLGNNREVYDKLLKNYAIERQLPYEDTQMKNVMTKKDYYSEMVNNLKSKLRVLIFFIRSLFLCLLSLLYY